jgi:fibronectin-binding autotransporter adhesin
MFRLLFRISPAISVMKNLKHIALILTLALLAASRADAQTLVKWATGNGNWDFATKNWKDASGNSTNYADGDAMLVDNTANNSLSTTVSLNTTVAPASLTINLTNRGYTLSGSGNFTGSGALTMKGNGSLGINTTNTAYTGSIFLNGVSSIISINNSAALGTGPVTVSNFATIIIGGNFSNAINLTAGASLTNNANLNSFNGNITSADATARIFHASSVTYGGSLQGFSGTIFFGNSGNILLSKGADGTTDLGSSNASFTSFISGGSLQPRNQNTTIHLGSLSGSAIFGGSQVSTGANTTTYSVGALNTNTSFSGKFVDVTSPNTNVALVKVGTGTLTLSGKSTHSGATTINAGALIGVTGGACSNSAFTVNSGATDGVSINASGGQFTVSNLTYATGTEYTLFAFSNNLPSAAVAPLFVQDSLAVNGTLQILVTGTELSAGTYPLIQYGNAISGTVPTVPFSLPPNVSGIITNDTANKRLSLIIAPNPPVLTSSTMLDDGTFQFGFTNQTGVGFTVFASTDVSLPFNNWSNLGPAVETPAASGQFQFTDSQATNNPQRFYRVRSP